MNCLVLSGTRTIVPSGTGVSCYRGPQSPNLRAKSASCELPNLSNPDSCGIFLTEAGFSARCGRVTDCRERAMIFAPLNQKGDVGKATLALHLTGERARRGRCVALIEADREGSALGWSQQRSREDLERLFDVVGLAREILRGKAPDRARGADQIVIVRPRRVSGLMRSALLAGDLDLILVERRCWMAGASAEIFNETRFPQLHIAARSALNRCAARALLTRETSGPLADPSPPLRAARVGQRSSSLMSCRPASLLPSSTRILQARGRLRRSRPESSRSVYERAVPEPRLCGVSSRSRRPHQGARSADNPRPRRRRALRAADNRRFGRHARPQDPRLPQRGQAVADLLQALLERELEASSGGRS